MVPFILRCSLRLVPASFDDRCGVYVISRKHTLDSESICWSSDKAVWHSKYRWDAASDQDPKCIGLIQVVSGSLGHGLLFGTVVCATS